MNDSKNLFEKLVAHSDQRGFFILSFSHHPLIQLLADNVTFDGTQRTHVQDIAQRLASLPAYLTSSADAGTAAKLPGTETCVTDELPVVGHVFKALGIYNQLCRSPLAD